VPLAAEASHLDSEGRWADTLAASFRDVCSGSLALKSSEGTGFFKRERRAQHPSKITSHEHPSARRNRMATSTLGFFRPASIICRYRRLMSALSDKYSCVQPAELRRRHTFLLNWRDGRNGTLPIVATQRLLMPNDGS
jgi:hypothetical protein